MNVLDYGAVGDGRTLCHESIQRSIDACAASGGGRVVVPPGTYRCGTIRLRSDVDLHIERGAVILSADRNELFPEICKTPFGNLPGQIQALIWAEGVERASVTGLGSIDGAHPEALSGREAAPITFRPALIYCSDCRDLAFHDVTMRNSAFWTLHLKRCIDVAVRGVTIRNNLNRINADGIDPDGCRNVTVSDCRIESGDDCVCLKSTEGDPCENIAVTNCILQTSCAAIKLGTEAIGPIRNVVVSNCIVHDSAVGIAMYMKDGSDYSNILFSNIAITSSGQFPILVDITPRYYREPAKGRIDSVAFDTISVASPGRFHVEGLPDSPVRNLTISNLLWNVTGPLQTEGVRKPTGARRTEADPDAPNHASEPYQLTVVHAKDVAVNNFRVTEAVTAPAGDGSDGSTRALSRRGRYRLEGVTGGTIEGFSRWQSDADVPPELVTDCTDLSCDLSGPGPTAP